LSLNRNIRNTLLLLGVSLIVLPAAISDGHERQGHGSQSDRHGPPASAVEKHARHKAEKESKHGAKGNKAVAYVFKGTFNLADSSVTVLKGNKHVRRAGLVGKTVVFDLSATRIRVADVNGDGKRDAADLKDGDKVVVQARLARRDPGTGPFAARKLVDQSSRHQHAADDQPAVGDHAGDEDSQGEDDSQGE
jgi:hypothetical protein